MDENVIGFSLEAVDNFSKVFGTFGKALGAAGGAWAATGGAVIAFTRAVAEQIGKFDDLAKRTGIARTALMELDFAAGQSGLTIENVTTSVQFLQRGMDDAQFGIGQAARGFERLGISTTDASGKMKSSQAVMYEVADALQGIEDPAQKTKIAMDLFGRSGAQMVQMMEGGSEGMRRMAQDAHFLGVALSDQAVANADAFGDEMHRVGSAIKGASYAIAGEWMPMMTGMARATANFIAESIPAIKEFAASFMRFMIGAFVVVEQIATNVWNGLKKLFTAEGFDKFLSSVWNGVKNVFSFVIDIGARASQNLGNMLVAVWKIIWTSFYETAKWAWMKVFDVFTGKDLAGTLGEHIFGTLKAETEKYRADFAAGLGGYISVAAEAGGRMGTAITDTLGISMEGISGRIDEIIKKFTVLGETVKATTEGQITPSLLEIYEKLLAQGNQRRRQIEAEIFFAQSFTEVWSLTFESLLTQAMTWNQLSSKMIRDTFETVTTGMGQAVGQAIVYGGDLGKALSALLKQAASDIIAMLVQVGIQRAILSMISIGANKTQSAGELSTGLAKVFTNSFASAAAIPVIGWAIAPQVATANTALAAAGATAAGATGAGIGAGLAGAAHGGLDYVPREQTYLLDQGERVLSPNQNEDLTSFLNTDRESGGGGLQIGTLNISVLENATSFDSLMQLSPAQMRELVASKMIEALNGLDRMGIRPVFTERTGR